MPLDKLIKLNEQLAVMLANPSEGDLQWRLSLRELLEEITLWYSKYA